MQPQRYLVCLESLVRTQAVYWIIPARLTIGFVLLWPLTGSAQNFDAYCHTIMGFAPLAAESTCRSLRFVEALSGAVLIVGFLTRLACFLAVPFFLARVAGSVGAIWVNSPLLLPNSPGSRDTWIDGVAYLAGLVLILDLLAVGGGRWSFDRWISHNLEG